jgi:ribose transport system permease protein
VVDLKYRRPGRYMISWVALGLTVVVAAIIQPRTFNSASLELMTALAGCLLVASIGQLLIVMMGEIDLSVPAYMTMAAALNVRYHEEWGTVTTALGAIVLCAILSAFSGMLVSVLRLNSIIVTLAMNTLLVGVLIQWLGQTYSDDGNAPEWLMTIGRKDFASINAIFVIALAVSGLAAFVLYRTRVGRSVAASGANRVASGLLGIRVHTVQIATFAAAGALYAVAGSLTGGFVQTPDATLGSTYQLQTLVAVAIAGVIFSGGPSSVSSLVAACLLLQVLDQALTLQGLDAGVRVLVQGVLLVLAVAAGAIARVSRQGVQGLVRRPPVNSPP